MPTKMKLTQTGGFLASLAAAGLLTSSAAAQVVFDFETDDQFDAQSEVTGDLDRWVESTNQALTGTRSIRFDNSAPQPFRSMTYDLPITIDDGTISVWFYDTVGQGGGTFTWGGSVILEDANDPSDFVAVEINDLPYTGAPGLRPYHATEGSVDRGITGESYDSDSLAVRSVGWHEIVFDISASETTVSVDGVGPADEAVGPGSSSASLRLRIMGDSASAGGFGNWTTATTGYPAPSGLVFFDDVTFSADLPSSATDILSFEDADQSGLGSGSGNSEYDTVAEFMVSPAYDEPNMIGFVNNFATTTTVAQNGTNAIIFDPGEPVFQNVVIDLSTASPGTITIPFYDTLGQNQDFDQIGAAFIIEDGNNPAEFIAAEIWNAEYPFAAGQKTYYFVARPIPGSTSGFFSSYFPARSVGWQTLEIELTNTYSRMTINGVGQDASNANTVYDGPGLDSNPKLRIMGDSPTLGGFANWQDSATWTDPNSPELDTLYLEKGTEYLYLDDISLPLPATASVNDWELY